MSRRLVDPLPPEALAAQRSAANPDSSVWVEANAGSGKTHVLTDRVLRLLLEGTRPEEVLCLTYTKAAAAEMRRRVAERLGHWALMSEKPLRASLEALIGAKASTAQQIRARRLFADALDTPGGLRVLTIHAFCESILHRFPVEAGVPFDFTVIEEFQRDTMILTAREAVLAAGLAGGPQAEAVETLFGHLSDFSLREAIEDALGRLRTLRRLLADTAAVKARLRARIQYTQPRSSAAIQAEIEHQGALLAGDVRTLVDALGGDPDKSSARFANALARADLNHPTCEDLIAAFTTGEGKPRSLMNAKERALHPDLHARFEAEQRRVCALVDELRAARLIERSEALFDVLDAIVARYEAQKRARSLLDFDDLIARTAALFRDDGRSMWVRYKLDANLTHILVDESQDTNEEQWVVVKLLASEFFHGLSAVERPRTVFAVGDVKQSIFSFQGAQPELFAKAGDEFEERAHAAEARFSRVPLETSFRTQKGILDAVDAVFASNERRTAVLARGSVKHASARADPGGTVTLWPPLQVVSAPAGDGEESTDTPGADTWPLEPVESAAGAARQVAMRIAEEIAAWVRDRRPLGARGRAVRADDVLILVQTRSAVFHELIRALAGAGLQTPGADRLMVTTHIAILDLLALGDVLLNPADDLQLAAVLRSPLFGLSEGELEALAFGRNGTLWQALEATSAGGASAAAGQRLRTWRSRLDFERPYEFFAEVLYADLGLRKFHARFGTAIDDLFSEFLELALAHEQEENPSLQGFLASMRAREVAITRELAGSRGVRVMTVHGAKGLEAPIVILADAASKPQGRQLSKPVIMDAELGLFLHAPRRDHVEQTLELRAKGEAAQWREYWRKLYVGMTRAEDELYVTGALTPGTKAETQLAGTWYTAIADTLGPVAEEQRDAAGAVTALVYPKNHPRPARLRKRSEADEAEHPAPALAPLPPHRVVETVRPSSAAEPAPAERALDTAAERVVDAELARRKGIAVHALLQHLTRIPPDQRDTVAARALATLLPEYPTEHTELAAKAVRILHNPEFAELFGPEARAEVPFLATAHRRGTEIRLAGRIDRLVVTPGKVRIVDFKSDAVDKPSLSNVRPAYWTQLGLYALLARELFPAHAVEAAILWTTPESLMILPAAPLLAAVDGFTLP